MTLADSAATTASWPPKCCKPKRSYDRLWTVSRYLAVVELTRQPLGEFTHSFGIV
jgi:hypothetical protein